jgi:ligand-binding sensor domain-containing protein
LNRLIGYHPENETYDQIEFSPDPFADYGGRINPLTLDKKNRLWLGTPSGVKMVRTDDAAGRE